MFIKISSLLIFAGIILMSLKKWTTPLIGKKFDPYFEQAEKAYGILPGLLSRIAWQESRFKPDIITGKQISSAGAVGLMQIVPKWHPDVNPYDPFASIYYAAEYLSRLHKRFGNWQLAVAAYNWGEGNLKKHGIDNAPLETRNYIKNIGSDINLNV